MQEVTVKFNPKGLRVFIDGEPDLRSKPTDEVDILAAIFEAAICQQHENYVKRKKREKPKNKKVMSSDNT